MAKRKLGKKQFAEMAAIQHELEALADKVAECSNKLREIVEDFEDDEDDSHKVQVEAAADAIESAGDELRRVSGEITDIENDA